MFCQDSVFCPTENRRGEIHILEAKYGNYHDNSQKNLNFLERCASN